MGRTHCCFDNARMESFFATFKKEPVVYRLHCSGMKRDAVRKNFFRWIETYRDLLYISATGETPPTPITFLP